MITPESMFLRVSEPKATESAHQKALMIWAAMNAHNDERLKLLFAIPNGGERNKIVAAGMKAEGVRSGVPDLCLPVPKFETHHCNQYAPSQQMVCAGLYIEMKRPSERLKRRPEHKWDTGGVKPNQVDWLNALEAQGYKCVVCYHWYEAASEIKMYLTGTPLEERPDK